MVLVILLFNLDQIVPMIGTIIKSAFGIEQVTGGAVGAAVLQGIKRGLFSNEAGMGSAPNAAATAAVPHPVKQGLIQSLGVFFDTMLVCTATAIMILLYSGLKFGDNAPQGVAVTQSALNEHLGSAGVGIIIVTIVIFVDRGWTIYEAGTIAILASTIGFLGSSIYLVAHRPFKFKMVVVHQMHSVILPEVMQCNGK